MRARLEELGAIGRTPEGGVTRLSYREEHAQAARLCARWMQDAGAEVGVDPWGNLFGIVGGSGGAPRPIAAGSHLDTVPNGGIFDGGLGVVAAIEAAAALRAAGRRLRHPLMLLGFAEEEGVSFSLGCLGSRGVAGRLPALQALVDRTGRSAADAIRAFDPGVPRRAMPAPPAAYLELHIEQGPILERQRTPLASVDAIVGIARMSFLFLGEANHAGTTPMEGRRDALWGAADLVAQVREMARATEGRAVGTVGQCTVSPGVPNVVPGRAEVTVEVRSADGALLDRLCGGVVAAAQTCAVAYGLTVEHRHGWTEPPVPLDPRIRAEVVAAAGDLGWPIATMSSWAGHDAKILAGIGPTGMIFVPSAGGISHSPFERTGWEDAARGAQLLCRALERLDAGDES
ncbi:MAG TPA: M20 family metallo-hydrolase [bacterium]|nr:M20 family metallo-hydrolase [bacterium]